MHDSSPSKFITIPVLGASIIALGSAIAFAAMPVGATEPATGALESSERDSSADPGPAGIDALARRSGDPPVRGPGHVEARPTREDHEDPEDPEAPAPSNDPDIRCALDQPSDRCAHLEPSQETLNEMARCGVVRFDMPGFMMSPKWEFDPDEDWAKEVGLTASERDRWAEIGRTFRHDFYEDMRTHARHAGIDEAFPLETPLIGIVSAISEAYGEDATKTSMGKVAKQRAGWSEATADDDVEGEIAHEDEFARRFANVGEDYEAALAEALGDDRAAELRHAKDGWPGLRIRTGHDCP